MATAPVFAASLITVTGEGRQLTITVTGSTDVELRKRVAQASDIADDRVRKNNERVLASAEKYEEAHERVIARAVRALCHAKGEPIPPEFMEPAPNGHDAQGGTQHADPAGAVHTPTDP